MDELRDAIFCDPNFINNFLAVDSTKLQAVLDACQQDLDALHFEEHITRERQLYGPICKVLNLIKRAVDDVMHSDNFLPFFDVSTRPIQSHHRNTTGLKPDLALFDGSICHWEMLMTPIEVKRQATYLKTGMKKLTQYAREMFAHQLHRRHIYGLAICGWDATFARFDRSGILYSKPINIRSQEFRRAFTGLMMLDGSRFGYDVAFTTQIQDGRIEYYVDLPAGAFASEGDSTFPEDISIDKTTLTDPDHLLPQLRTRRLKVVERLCHREGIRGRGTIVVRLRKVIRPGYLEEPEETRRHVKKCTKAAREQHPTGEVLGTQDYVLKMMWRDPGQKVEGEALERLVGAYGIGQHMWHIDVLQPCSLPSCEWMVTGSCDGCLDMTPHRDGVLVAKNLMDLDIEIPEENDEEETEYNAVRTNKYSKTNARRAPRIYCRLLTSTIGSPLRSAESPRQLLQAVLDAILGYWRLVNLGVLHRDISDGNVLMLREGQGYNKRDWKIPSAASSVLDLELDRSEIFLWGTLHRLGREPTGMLNDFDLFTTQGKMGAVFFDSSPSRDAECEVEPEPKRRKTNAGIVSSTSSSSNRAKGTLVESHPSDSVKVEGTIRPIVEFRVGTAAFMSARVQDVQPGYRYEHTFVDDLESFLWLILVCAVEHIDSPGGQPTEGALKLQHKFAGRDHSAIAITKPAFLIHTSMMLHELASCENSWATDPAIVSVVRKLGQYFGGIYLDSASSECTPTEVFPAVVEIFTSALAS